MGFFGDWGAAARQRDQLFEVKASLTESDAWKEIYSSPYFGSGIRVGFATVDCRRCGSTDSGLLLDQSIWEWQTHKISYATCLKREQGLWVAEYQGPQAARTKAAWLDAEWTTYDQATGEAWVMEGVRAVKKFEGTFVLEEWILGDFISKGQTIKRALTDAIMRSDNAERKLELQRLLAIENPNS